MYQDLENEDMRGGSNRIGHSMKLQRETNSYMALDQVSEQVELVIDQQRWDDTSSSAMKLELVIKMIQETLSKEYNDLSPNEIKKVLKT